MTERPLGPHARARHIEGVTEIAPSSQRLDRWLWCARIFKTRALAGKVVSGNGARITRAGRTERTEKPGFAVRPGDTIAIMKERSVRVLEVTALAERRGPATEAQTLYIDQSPPAAPAPEAGLQ